MSTHYHFKGKDPANITAVLLYVTRVYNVHGIIVIRKL